MATRSLKKVLLVLLAVALALALAVAVLAPRVYVLFGIGERAELRPDAGDRAAAPHEPTLLVLAIDGVERGLLYGMLREGALPELAKLLGSPDGRAMPHAYFDEKLLATMPSSTLAAWAGIFTGEPPAVNGVAGNEYFVRETGKLTAPAPVSVLDPSPVLATYTDGYANKLLAVPTVYERMRKEREARGQPDLSVWVSMSQFHAGADRLLLAKRTIMADAFAELLKGAATDDAAMGMYASLDGEVVDTVIEALQDFETPHVLTIYLTGTDHYAHGSTRGPDDARRRYLTEVVDPALGRLRAALDAKHALDERTVVVVSDHGHTEVVHDAAHALSTGDDDDPPAVLRAAGFRVREFTLDDAATKKASAVLAYGGAVAYVYVADRSTCPAGDGATSDGGDDAPCDWTRPPRFREDVLAAAEAFWEANRTGRGAPGMKGTLDAIFTREPRPYAEDDLPFAVYAGGGKLVSVKEWLAAEPHPTYVAVERRLAELAEGRFGERAGDILLLAHNGDREDAKDRYYFADLYRSWHGSPAKRDSEIPLIVARRGQTPAALAALTREAMGADPRQCDVAKLLLAAVRR